MSKHIFDQSAIPAWKNCFLRLIGEWPLIGPPPLSTKQYDKLWQTETSFVDYFPVKDYEDGAYILDDGINLGLMYELFPTNTIGKSHGYFNQLNDNIARALDQLPKPDDSTPYTIQIYLVNEEIDDLGELLHAKTDPDIRETAFSKYIFDIMSAHSSMLTNENGLFDDSRCDYDRGWRVSKQRVFMCVYRLLDEKTVQQLEKKNKRGLLDMTQKAINPFLNALGSSNIKHKPLKPHTMVNWLGQMLSGRNHQHFSEEAMDRYLDLPSCDLGELVINNPPKYEFSTHASEQGIFDFGGKYWRYLTFDGFHDKPKDGLITSYLSDFEDDAKSGISIWEQMPAGSMMAWTITPEPKKEMDRRLDTMVTKSKDRKNINAQYASMQADEARKACKEGNRIYYVQMGCYISDHSKEYLIYDKTLQARNIIEQTRCLRVLDPEYDLFPSHSFIKNMPFCYDFKSDRKHAKRAKMTYLNHLSTSLPFYGSFPGSDNPCYIYFNQDGTPAYLNPFMKSDRVRAAHSIMLGPTGSGKSAQLIYKAMMSMAVNRPIQFILDKGGSFKLLVDLYEQQGLKVKRIMFHQASQTTLAPFVETQKALAELRGETPDETHSQDIDEEEKRSYIAEMMNVLTIMITGAREEEARNLTQTDKAAIQDALIRGLELSEANGSPHARPEDIYHAMLMLSEEETNPTIQLSKREMADALRLWITGPGGKMFNQFAEPFSDDYDCVYVDWGYLTNDGNEAMFATAGLSIFYYITALGESLQMQSRAIDVISDETHYSMKQAQLVDGMTEGTKVWRKLGIWLMLATQDFVDFKDNAKKMLSQAEFWWLLSMEESDAEQIKRFKALTNEQKSLIRKAGKESGRFSELVMLGTKKFDDALLRSVPPSLCLALAQTEKDEKAARQILMTEHGITELEAAKLVAERIQKSRTSYQERFNHEAV